jgi:hypothetical protein
MAVNVEWKNRNRFSQPLRMSSSADSSASSMGVMAPSTLT